MWRHCSSLNRTKYTNQVGDSVCSLPRSYVAGVVSIGQNTAEYLNQHAQAVALVASWYKKREALVNQDTDRQILCIRIPQQESDVTVTHTAHCGGVRATDWLTAGFGATQRQETAAVQRLTRHVRLLHAKQTTATGRCVHVHVHTRTSQIGRSSQLSTNQQRIAG